MELRDQILNADDLAKEPLVVPEWGVTVYVRAMTAAERDAYESAALEDQKALNEAVADERDPERRTRARLCAMTVVNEQGERIFADSDVDRLAKKSGSALTRVLAVALRLNKMTEADVSELVKNSQGGTTAA